MCTLIWQVEVGHGQIIVGLSQFLTDENGHRVVIPMLVAVSLDLDDLLEVFFAHHVCHLAHNCVVF